MIDLLYHSHTIVPVHLEELIGLGILERDEQVLMALDGVLLDDGGKRLSGPTLHDYCLLTSLRVLLWARDYGRHLCYAFPISELYLVDGIGIDPLHAQLHLAFAAPGEEEQHFTFTLLPLTDLQPAVSLLQFASEAMQELIAQGIDPREAGYEMAALLGAHIYGPVEGAPPSNIPYRWDDAGSASNQANSVYQRDPSSLPPEQIYSASRLVRSAWDTMRRTLREAQLPSLDFNGSNLRDLTDAVRAINELVSTVSTNPAARDMAMAFLNRRSQSGSAPEAPQQQAPPDERFQSRVNGADAADGRSGSRPVAYEWGGYYEIPLRRGVDSASVSSTKGGEPRASAPAASAEETLRDERPRHTIRIRRRDSQAGIAEPPVGESGQAASPAEAPEMVTPDDAGNGSIPLRRRVRNE